MRRLVLPFALILAVVGSGLVVAAVTRPADFTLRIAPGSQAVRQGEPATYGIGIDRRAGFTKKVSLSVSGLPATVTGRIQKGVVSGLARTGMTAAIRRRRATCLAVAGRRSSAKARSRARQRCLTVTRKQAAVVRIVPLEPSMPARRRLTTMAALSVKTNQGGVTPPGTYGFTITARSASSRTLAQTRGALVVLPPGPAGTPDFSLSLTPASQTIVQSDDAPYEVAVTRSGGFTGPVAVEAGALPAGTGAALAPVTLTGNARSRMTVSTEPAIATGAYAIWVVGTATIGGIPVKRLAAATLVVDENRRFTVQGDLTAPLGPGLSQPLDLSLTNPQRFAIAVRDLSVTVGGATDAAGCSGSDNFAVRQVPADGYPIVIPAGSTRTLSEAGVPMSAWPQVEMLDLAANQDACKHARFSLRYSGSATKP